MEQRVQKKTLIYSGKAKLLYSTDSPGYAVMEFRDDATAFNGVKKATLPKKGIINNYVNAFIMQKLAASGIPTQFVALYSDRESVVKQLDMIKVECVVRNFTAGNLCVRLGLEWGIALNPPIFEWFLKSDPLNDPPINESIIKTFKWASEQELSEMKTYTLKVNDILSKLCTAAGLMLVDFKLEFGRYQNQIVLGDEFTPDGCRIWDQKTRKILDKDRFRKDLGDIIEGYEEIAQRLGISLPEIVTAK